MASAADGGVPAAAPAAVAESSASTPATPNAAPAPAPARKARIIGRVPVPDSPDVHAARALLGKLLRVSMSDGRAILGSLMCFDDNGHLILQQAEQWRDPAAAATEAPTESVSRVLGTVMVPSIHIRKIELAHVADSESAAVS